MAPQDTGTKRQGALRRGLKAQQVEQPIERQPQAARCTEVKAQRRMTGVSLMPPWACFLLREMG